MKLPAYLAVEALKLLGWTLALPFLAVIYVAMLPFEAVVDWVSWHKRKWKHEYNNRGDK